MPDRHKRKTPQPPGQRGPKQGVGVKPVSRAVWLPEENAGFAAWGRAAERADREWKIAYQDSRLKLGNDKRFHDAEIARELVYYTLERAYPVGFWEGMKDLKAGKTHHLEIYIVFLEADPYFFRSGYAKAEVIRHLNRLTLTAAQRCRLQNVVLHVVDQGFRREFRAYCRLARHVQTKEWLHEVETCLSSSDPNLALRSQWILDACLKK